MLKAAREKQKVIYKGVPIRLSAISQKRNLEGKKGLERSIQSHEKRDLHPRLLYPAQLSFRMEEQVKCFPDKVNLKEYIITKSLLYEILKGLI